MAAKGGSQASHLACTCLHSARGRGSETQRTKLAFSVGPQSSSGSLAWKPPLAASLLSLCARCSEKVCI